MVDHRIRPNKAYLDERCGHMVAPVHGHLPYRNTHLSKWRKILARTISHNIPDGLLKRLQSPHYQLAPRRL